MTTRPADHHEESDDNNFGDNSYDEIYRDNADSGGPPWEIGGPQPAIRSLLDQVKGPRVLDIGCGTGDLSLELARRGLAVTAIDISRVAIGMAKAKAEEEGLQVDFRVQDASQLDLDSAMFDAVFDSGLLHGMSDAERDGYLARLSDVCATEATLVVLAVSLEADQGWGVTAEWLGEVFAPPTWAGTSIDDVEVAAEMGGRQLSLPGFLLSTQRASP